MRSDAQRPGAVDASGGDERAEHHRESHRQARKHEGDRARRAAATENTAAPLPIRTARAPVRRHRVAHGRCTGSPASNFSYSCGWSSFHTSHLRRSARASRHASRREGPRRSCHAAARPCRQHADVVTDRDGLRLGRESRPSCADAARRGHGRAARHRRVRSAGRCMDARRRRTRRH